MERVPAVTTREGLLEVAGLSAWLTSSVWVPPFRAPLQPQERVSLRAGSLVVFLQTVTERPQPLSLNAMLVDAEGWDRQVALPFGY